MVSLQLWPLLVVGVHLAGEGEAVHGGRVLHLHSRRNQQRIITAIQTNNNTLLLYFSYSEQKKTYLFLILKNSLKEKLFASGFENSIPPPPL